MLVFKQLRELVIIFGLLFVSTMYAQSLDTQIIDQRPLVDVLVFSFDRPMQLDAYLKSLQTYASGSYAVHV